MSQKMPTRTARRDAAARIVACNWRIQKRLPRITAYANLYGVVSKVWLDDKPEVPWRAALFPAPEWVCTRWPDETIELLKTGTITALSLDHDLDDKDAAEKEGRKERTGYDVVLWLEEQVKLHGFVPPQQITVHSQNGPGRDRIAAAIRQIERYAAENKRG